MEKGFGCRSDAITFAPKGGAPGGLRALWKLTFCETILDFSLRNRLAHLLAKGPSLRSIQVAPGLAIGSVKGPSRSDNQDRAVVARIVRPAASTSITVAVLCDGMGGMLEGGHAAALAASTFIAELASSVGYLDERLHRAILSANTAVYSQFGGKGGTTLTAVAFDDRQRGFAAHVGDTRLYCRTADELSLVTTDDTVQGVVRARSHQGNEDDLDSQLIQFIGIGDEIEPHILPLFDAPNSSDGVAWLLTSDGAHGLGRQMLHGLSRNATSVSDLLRKLMFVADAAGVSDNATAVLLLPGEVTQSPAFHEGTTISVWTPTTSLELWIGEVGPNLLRQSTSNAIPAIEKNARPPGKKKSSPRAKKKAGAAAVREDAFQGPSAQDEDKETVGPQLNITFGDDPAR